MIAEMSSNVTRRIVISDGVKLVYKINFIPGTPFASSSLYTKK